jgi:DNA-binding NarL/FixJ family response regulator
VAVEERIRVLLADDHAPTRALVRDALEGGGFEVVAEAASGPQAVDAGIRLHPQVACLDIRMPGSGIDAAESLAAIDPPPAIVMLTVSEDDEDLFAALRAGASGYLLKGMNLGELPDRLRAVLAGEAVLPGSLAARLVAEFRLRERRRLLTATERRNRRLTTREWEVLELLARGMTTLEIADQLYVSRVTVRSHVTAILRKLQVRSRSAAVAVLQSGRY